MREAIILAIEQERDALRLLNGPAFSEPGQRAEGPQEPVPCLTREELMAELHQREENLRRGAEDSEQCRAYEHIVRALQHGPYLWLAVQASAGTGKSYLLTTVYLWCLLHGLKVKVAAPTGIAAANIEIEGTEVRACTLHNLFDLDAKLHTRLDLAKPSRPKVAELMALQVLLVDEFSMLHDNGWTAVEDLLSTIDHSKRPKARDADRYDQVHLILFSDFKQLPPATSRPPFITLPSVCGGFSFRMLRQNRRVCSDAARAAELALFHQVLTDISEGKASSSWRRTCAARLLVAPSGYLLKRRRPFSPSAASETAGTAPWCAELPRCTTTL